MDMKTAVALVGAGVVAGAGGTAIISSAEAAPGDKVLVVKGALAQVQHVCFYRQPGNEVLAEVFATAPQADGGAGEAGTERFLLTGAQKTALVSLLNGALLKAWQAPRGLDPEG